MGHLSATLNTTPVASATLSQNVDDEVIPTAIVIKNIPFNVKRETLLDIIVRFLFFSPAPPPLLVADGLSYFQASLSIPTPYAFNYHLDQQGAFRGLAFANFRQAADADAVVAALNGFDVQGRKLRVEYKKVLQAGEKERIEREKAIRRMRSMQLEKEQTSATLQYDDYGTLSSSAFSPPQRSFSASSAVYQQPYSPPSVSPMPLAQPYTALASAPAAPIAPPTPTASDRVSANELDLNDPSTLEIYSRILLFKDDRMRDELAFSRNLSPQQRRVVHLIAQKLGVYHYSIGEGEERYAVVTRIDPQRVCTLFFLFTGNNFILISSLKQQQQQQQQQQPTRHPHTLSRAPSAYLTPSISQAPPSLRVKKSMPDMKTLHSAAPRLSSRSSNGNIREGFATVAAPTRRISSNFGSLFGSSNIFGGGSIPPVPSLPNSAISLNGGHDSPGGVVRQPRGPGAGGFGPRSARVGVSESHASRGGLEAQTYEPLEF